MEYDSSCSILFHSPFWTENPPADTLSGWLLSSLSMESPSSPRDPPPHFPITWYHPPLGHCHHSRVLFRCVTIQYPLQNRQKQFVCRNFHRLSYRWPTHRWSFNQRRGVVYSQKGCTDFKSSKKSLDSFRFSWFFQIFLNFGFFRFSGFFRILF